ncbi:MAG: carbohydrate ABC transporter substrate-binding protein, partial [Anaerolineae bacterium]|nr:carbohydrate ABC transporter substrate-binding protein [Anaerolineae bacterium]
MLKKIVLLVALVALVALGFGGVSAQGVTELTIWWAEWDPANYLQQLGNEYTEETGITINVVQTPWGEFYNRV